MYYILMLEKYLELKPVVHELRIETQFYSIVLHEIVFISLFKPELQTQNQLVICS